MAKECEFHLDCEDTIKVGGRLIYYLFFILFIEKEGSISPQKGNGRRNYTILGCSTRFVVHYRNNCQ